MKKEGKIKTTIRLDRSLWKAVQHQAIEADVTAEAIVHTALNVFLQEVNPKLWSRWANGALEKPKKGGK